MYRIIQLVKGVKSVKSVSFKDIGTYSDKGVVEGYMIYEKKLL